MEEKKEERVKGTILIVDGDIRTRSVLSEFLLRNLRQFHIIATDDVTRALEWVEKTMPDAILAGTYLPGGLTGLDFFRQISDKRSKIGFILMSETLTEREVLREGVDGFLRKPIIIEDLIGKILGVIVKKTFPEAVNSDG